MIISVLWSEVPDLARVVDPAGNVFHVLPRTFPTVAQLRDASGRVHQLPIDPNARVPRLYESEDMALDSLRRVFHVEIV